MLSVYRKFEKTVQRVPMHPSSVSTIINILHCHGTFVLISEPITIHYCSPKSLLHSDEGLLSFYLVGLFWSRIHPGHHYIFRHHASQVLLAFEVSRMSCFDDLDSFEECWSGRLPLSWDFLIFSLRFYWDCVLLKGGPKL